MTEDRDSDPDHLGSSTWAPPALGARGLPPKVESAEGAPHLPFGEAPGIHTDAAKDVLGEGKKDCGFGKAKIIGTDVKKLDSSSD